jgi:hypothetical protein
METNAPPPSSATPSVGAALAKVAVLLLVVAVGIVLAVRHFTGADRRSVEAYCQTWQTEGMRLHAKWAASQRQAEAGDNPFGALSTVMGAPADLAEFFAKLDAVAPAEIEPAVARYRDAWQQTAGNLGQKASDPLSFLMAQLVVSAQTVGVERQLDSWTRSHCSAVNGS